MAVNRVQRADGTVEFDVTGVTAAAADVTAGKKFVTAAGELADGAMPSVTQATPSISVSSAGLITASATQAAGKVAAGTKSATKQLTTQAAKTVTPTTTEQIAVAAGVYTTGAVKVAAVPEVEESIVSGTFTATKSTKSYTISGLSFSKVKTVYLGVETRSYGGYEFLNVVLQNGECVVVAFAVSGTLTIFTESSVYKNACSFTYANGTLTITTSSSYSWAGTTFDYLIIGT